MVKQDRAIRTRQVILSAAAKAFEEHGYQAATISEILATAACDQGALYFHFPSKEHLAEGVLHEQDQRLPIPDRACKVQQFVDTMVLHAYLLQTDPMVEYGVRLALDQQAQGLDRSGPFRRWSDIGIELLEKAQAQGELMPHVIPAETADVAVGAFAGCPGHVPGPAQLPGPATQGRRPAAAPAAQRGGPLRARRRRPHREQGGCGTGRTGGPAPPAAAGTGQLTAPASTPPAPAPAPKYAVRAAVSPPAPDAQAI